MDPLHDPKRKSCRTFWGEELAFLKTVIEAFKAGVSNLHYENSDGSSEPSGVQFSDGSLFHWYRPNSPPMNSTVPNPLIIDSTG